MDAASDVFAERGFHGASIEEICLRADLTTGAFYSNYTDRYEFFYALLRYRTEQMFEQQMAYVERSLSSFADPFSQPAFEALTDHQERPDILLRYLAMLTQSRILAMREPATAATIAAIEDTTLDAQGELLTRLLELDGRVPRIEPTELARFSLTLWQEIYFQRFGGSGVDNGDRLYERIAPRLLSLLSRPRTEPPSEPESCFPDRKPGAPTVAIDPDRSSELRALGRENGTRGRKRTVATLIEAASAAFFERGLHGTSISDICHRAGLTTGAYYSNFNSKIDLLAAAAGYRRDLVLADFAHVVKSVETHPEPVPAELVMGFGLDTGDAGLTANMEHYTVLRYEIEILAQHDPRADRLLAANDLPTVEWVSQSLTRLLAAAELTLAPDVDMYDAVRIVAAFQKLRVRRDLFPDIADQMLALTGLLITE